MKTYLSHFYQVSEISTKVLSISITSCHTVNCNQHIFCNQFSSRTGENAPVTFLSRAWVSHLHLIQIYHFLSLSISFKFIQLKTNCNQHISIAVVSYQSRSWLPVYPFLCDNELIWHDLVGCTLIAINILLSALQGRWPSLVCHYIIIQTDSWWTHHSFKDIKPFNARPPSSKAQGRKDFLLKHRNPVMLVLIR